MHFLEYLFKQYERKKNDLSLRHEKTSIPPFKTKYDLKLRNR